MDTTTFTVTLLRLARRLGIGGTRPAPIPMALQTYGVIDGDTLIGASAIPTEAQIRALSQVA